jgi:hypothetical protein
MPRKIIKTNGAIRRTRGCSTLRKAGDDVTLTADDESVAKIQLRNI